MNNLESTDNIPATEDSVRNTHTGLILNCPPSMRSRTLNPYTYAPIPQWQPEPQFWYRIACENKEHYGDLNENIDQYGFLKLPQPEKSVTIFEEMQIERPERYLPGEIYKRKTPKEPVSMSDSTDCSIRWKPKTKVFCTQFDPETLEQRPLLEDNIIKQDVSPEIARQLLSDNDMS